jgi:class 3 adenylate cyclase
MLKLATILFADVVGSTARAETLHPEDVRALMADFFAAMAREIEAEGGTIEKYVGDAIMAVFGVPAAHEDDAVRAVRAARRMLERLRAWNDARDQAEKLELRIGLSTGEVLAAGLPGADLLVSGDAVNVAARLQQAAEPGTIVVGERTARAARSQFELRALDEPLVLKGKSESVTAWLVESDRPAGESRGVPGLAAPLVGRDHELAFLQTTFDRVRRERRPELVTLLGDAGIGKSRLVREFLGPLEVDAKVLVGRCPTDGQGLTLSAFAEMLKAEAVVLDTDPAGVAWTKIAQLVETSIDAELIGGGARTAAALASTLGLQPPGDPLASLDPRERYRELVNAWRALLASLARGAPVVAVVEDLHWADPTMMDVLDELAERLEGPILFLCTARSDLLRSRPDWGGGRRSFSSLPLDPLSGEETARLVALLLDLDELAEGVRRRILERSEGNPFFLEEILRHLIDEGLIVQEDGRLRVHERIGDLEIPDTVHAVVLARLDLLTLREKQVAQRAAVVGRTFWDGAVGALVGAEDLDAALQTLRRREFVLERLSSSIAGQTEFVFKHVLIRDVAYRSLPRRERGRAHAETAAWIEQASGQRTGELAELLAHHYDAAFSFLNEEDLRRKARAHLLTAAANAHRRFAIQQGERFARRAVELSQGAAERVEALEALGDLHYLAFDGDAAWGTYSEALGELSEEDPAYARLAGKAALFGARWIGTMQALPETNEVLSVIDAGLRAAPGPGRDRALLLVDRGFLLSQRAGVDDDAADRAVQAALAAAEELDDPDLLSAALDLVQSEEIGRGRYDNVYRAGARRLELVPRMTDVKEIGDSYAMAAWPAHYLGRYREAENHATACIERSRGIDPGSYLHGLVWRVQARFELGEWEGALADQAELERVAAQDQREWPAGYTMRAYSCAALCRELRGEVEEADRYLALVGQYLDAHPLGPRGSYAGAHLARVLARRGRFDEALELIPFVPRSGAAALTLVALCEITAARSAWELAPGLVAAAREEAAVGAQLSLPLVADRLEGLAAGAAGDVQQAVLLLGRSAGGFAALEAPWEAAWSRLLLAEALAATDSVRAERKLGAALPVFERLGSVRELERARGLVAAVVPRSG